MIRNLEDRSYFLQPVMTNGEVTKEESCDTSQTNLEEKKSQVNGSEDKSGSTEASSSNDGFVDKQRIEKWVNG